MIFDTAIAVGAALLAVLLVASLFMSPDGKN